MFHHTTHIAQKLKGTATLLILLLCVCSAMAREKNRAIALPFEDSVYNFRMMFEYDSWNRVQRIVYPDSEVVTYNYDLAGNLNRVHTYKANHRDTLIKNILYDEFGHRTQVNFGNGVTTNYTYDILQRLSTLQTYSNNASLQKILYSFDLEDNITKVENTAGGANGLGGAYVNTYNYDGLYRLTAANGSYSGNNTNYSLEMAYTPAGRLCGKIQDYTATANTYAYSQNAKPHAVRRYYNGLTNELYNLLWDANGNLAQQTVYSVANNATTYQGMRMLFWDEDDRLNLVAGDGYLSYYAYGHDGNRAIKMTGNAAIDQTGMLLNSTNLENITIYPNEYLTVTQAEYTKYYYAGGNRIASKIGTGGFEKMTRLCTLDQGPTYNANNLLNFVLNQVTNTANQPNDEYPVNTCSGYNVATELLTNPLPDFYISQTNLNFTQNNLLQQFRQNLTGGTEAVYFFHSDHLGSASWITNNTGLPVQHLQYLPFGEHFVNEHSSGYDERFTFTGKERDAETGYYYHGARFNSSDIGWLSVDPMADKYPEITPYHYCHWNPIKILDPTGEFDISIHQKITEQAMKKSGLITKTTKLFNLNLNFGVGTRADVLGIFKPWHFDNMNNYYAVCTQWIEIYKEINTTIRNIGNWAKKLGSSDVVELGRLLHNVQDFYSHSNYAELYIQYYKSSNDGALPKSIPTFDEGIKDEKFNNLLKKQLRTGDYDFFDNEKFDINPFREQADEPTSHNKMNKDKANTFAGKLAKQAAIKHTIKILRTLE